jgi:hypothetical protein
LLDALTWFEGPDWIYDPELDFLGEFSDNGLPDGLRGRAVAHLCMASSNGWPFRLVCSPEVTPLTIEALKAFISGRCVLGKVVSFLTYHRLPTTDFPPRMEALSLLIRAHANVPEVNGTMDYVGLFCSQQQAVQDEDEFRIGLEHLLEMTVLLFKTREPSAESLAAANRTAKGEVHHYFNQGDFGLPWLCCLRWHAIWVMFGWAADQTHGKKFIGPCRRRPGCLLGKHRGASHL